MDRFGLSGEHDEANLAIRSLAVEPMGEDEALAMQGMGWVGDFEVMRTSRTMRRASLTPVASPTD